MMSCTVCNATCQSAAGAATFCGDGVITGVETCDDGGSLAGNGCSATCTVETGYRCSGAPSVCTPMSTCGEIRLATATAADGTYFIDPDGAAGSIAPARVYCDMTNGGWTLVMASNRLSPDDQTVSTTVLPNSGTYLPVAFVRALAISGTQVHIRTAGLVATQSVTSTPNTGPIVNLRAGQILSRGGTAAMWTGPFSANMFIADVVLDTLTYPDIYWARGNAAGLHLNSFARGWTETNVSNMEVYVR